MQKYQYCDSKLIPAIVLSFKNCIGIYKVFLLTSRNFSIITTVNHTNCCIFQFLVCPWRMYKSLSGNHACTECPANSVTTALASVYCQCMQGFHRVTASNYDLPCKQHFIDCFYCGRWSLNVGVCQSVTLATVFTHSSDGATSIQLLLNTAGTICFSRKTDQSFKIQPC